MSIWLVTVLNAQVSFLCGKYAGTGSSKSITGFGFQPDFIMIKADNASYSAVVKISSMVAGESQNVTSTAAFLTDAITSIDADGFTIGTNTSVNNSGTTYYWMACVQGTDFQVGSYTGDDVWPTRNVTVGSGAWRADFVIVVPDVWASSPPTYFLFNDGAGWMQSGFPTSTSLIYGTQSTDGFNVNGVTGPNVLNKSGKTYYYAAWNAFSGGMCANKYTGNGTDNRNVTGCLDFDPVCVITNNFAVASTKYIRTKNITADYYLPLNAAAGESNGIQTFSTSGGNYFQVGSTFGSANVSGTVYYYAAFGGSTAGALPIKLTEFKGEYMPVNNTVLLKWTTATETNNDYFTIEKCGDEIGFEEVIKIMGAGNSSILINYSVVDDNPLPGISYYRLKQTDFDGKYSYSKLIAVDKNAGTSDFVFPNPSNGTFTLKLNESSVSPESIVIYDLLWREVYNSDIIYSPVSGTVNIVLDEHILSGMYYIIATGNNEVYTAKLLILR